MTRTPAAERGIALLSGAHRVIRVLDPSEGPFAGALVTDGEAVAVCRDAVELSGWEGWRFSGSEHVAGPMDLVRRADGHDVLLPWCTERVSSFIARRGASGEPLSSGECGTLLVSLLRALGELGTLPSDVEIGGTWWLTDDGRPVLVIGEGEKARAGVTLLIMQIREASSDRTLGRLLATVHAGIEKSIAQQPAVPSRLLDQWEEALLEIAAPRALRRDARDPDGERLTVRTIDIADGVAPGAVRATRRRGRRSGVRGPVPRWASAVRRSIAAAPRDVAARLRVRPRRPRSAASVPRRSPGQGASPTRSGRRRPLLIAGAAAVAVLVVGVMWPAGEGRSDTPPSSSTGPRAQRVDDSSAASEPAGSESTPSPSPVPVESTPADADADADAGDESAALAAATLWRQLLRCVEGGDLDCADALAPGSTGVVDAFAPMEPGEREFTLLDEYGDIAVIRVDAAGLPTMEADETTTGTVLVLLRLNERWLVRDVYDVADQPG